MTVQLILLLFYEEMRSNSWRYCSCGLDQSRIRHDALTEVSQDDAATRGVGAAQDRTLGHEDTEMKIDYIKTTFQA